jgi:Ca2+-binding RTX toxin-like protein
VSSAANGVDISVTGDYVATAATSNNKSLADVGLQAASAGTDINMTAATGNFGFVIRSTVANTGDTMVGSAKADSIFGGNGSDSLGGNSGNDTILPGTGNDTISAGAGADSIVFAGANLTALDSIDGGSGADVITVPAAATSSPDFDRITNLTSITTTNDAGDTTVAIADIAETTAQVITITSIGDAATKGLVTTNAADSATTTFSMVGADGDDVLVGSLGNDTLIGGANGDTITGGTGADVIQAGAGTDDIVMTAAVAADGTLGVDTVTGFAVAADDLGTFSHTNLELLSFVNDIVDAGDDATSVAATAAFAISTVINTSAAFNIATGSGTAKNILLSNATYANAAAFQADFRALGTAPGEFDAGDAFFAAFDNGVDTTTIALVSTAAGLASDGLLADAVVTPLLTLDVADASTLTDNEFLNFVA